MDMIYWLRADSLFGHLTRLIEFEIPHRPLLDLDTDREIHCLITVHYLLNHIFDDRLLRIIASS